MGDNFIWATKNGDLSLLEELVASEGCNVNQEFNGRSPIHYAADYGHVDIIGYLLSKGADINAKDKYGVTPLLSAIYESHTGCVKLLLEKGADKNGTSPTGQSYIECAESDEIRKLLQ